MKTPYQGETRGIMMSGDSPAPTAHGDHLYEIETVVIGEPPVKSVSDKAVQMSPSDFGCEPFGNSSKMSYQSMANQDNSDFDLSSYPTVKIPGERRSIDMEEEISNEEILSLPPTSKEMTAKSDDVMKSDEIETAADQTDSHSTAKFTVNPPQEEDSCLINCLFYLDECCTCTIV